MTLDDLRARFPLLGFGLYALTPGGPVTLEVYSGDEVFSFAGVSEAAAIATAFPNLDAPATSTPEPTTSIFD